MLTLWIGYGEFKDKIPNPDDYFDLVMSPECIDTDIGRRIVKECSDIETVVNYATLILPNGEFISPKELSSGAKNLLIMMFAEEDVICDMEWCGDNCNKFVAEIANQKDITLVTTRWYIPYSRGAEFKDKIRIGNTGKLVGNLDEFFDHVIGEGIYEILYTE